MNNLSRAIFEIDPRDVYRSAYDIGQVLRSEDGVVQSLESIEKHSNGFHRRHL